MEQIVTTGRASRSNASGVAPPWVLVTGGAYGAQGMDGANAALADLLLDQGRTVHVVAHRIGEELQRYPNLRPHLVPTPGGSFFIGEFLLDRTGRQVAEQVLGQFDRARVLVNGANCLWGDVNWVHSVHNAWPCHDAGAPLQFRLKNRIAKLRACARERNALGRARLLIANSQSTRDQVVRELGIAADRIRVVYLGTDERFGPVSQTEREAARQWLGVAELGSRPDRRIAAFVGALSFDNNKGLDTLLQAWLELTADPDWDVDLVAAGGGSGVARWSRWVQEHGLSSRVRLLGHTDRVADVLAAADVLISPVRYEAYGLNVQEAICRGIPAIVSSCAGVAERYPDSLGAMLLKDPEDVSELKSCLRAWRAETAGWKQRFAPLGATLRAWTWRKMAHAIVATVEQA